GARAARGDFITTHDADDWSHPEKIAQQVAHLMAYPDVMGVCTHWVRVDAQLRVTQNWRPSEKLIHYSHSSFLFRQQVLTDVGTWD
ncbi:glycosyltransferase, partial [Streptococcus pyogenes]